jgi:hypothetical protein
MPIFSFLFSCKSNYYQPLWIAENDKLILAIISEKARLMPFVTQ